MKLLTWLHQCITGLDLIYNCIKTNVSKTTHTLMSQVMTNIEFDKFYRPYDPSHDTDECFDGAVNTSSDENFTIRGRAAAGTIARSGSSRQWK